MDETWKWMQLVLSSAQFKLAEQPFLHTQKERKRDEKLNELSLIKI